MGRRSRILAAVAALILAAAIALQTGIARTVFFLIFDYLKGNEKLGSTVLRQPPENSPYQRWLDKAKRESPVFEGMVIHDVEHVALRPWPQQGEGVTGLYLRFADYSMTDGRILEIPPSGRTVSQRHLYEKGVYILSGTGYTTLQQDGQPMQRVDWKAGTLFTVPLNVLHQHYNVGNEPARMLMVATFPIVLNVMNGENFIDANDHAFVDRYDGAPGFLKRTEDLSEFEAAANYVEDVRTATTRRDDSRGWGHSVARWQMAGNSMLGMHTAEIPPRTHLKAHRHAADAFILMLSGEGYSVAWREGAWDQRVRVDWRAGTLFVPPTFWYHQHFNSGSTPARHLAFHVTGLVRNIGLGFMDQIEVDMPAIRDEWERELEKARRNEDDRAEAPRDSDSVGE